MQLSREFITGYIDREPEWGFGGLGEVIFYRTYSRKKEDGTKEYWWEVVQRVVEAIMGTYSGVLNDEDITHYAEEMYEAIFSFKFMPSGRGLWALGTDIIEERGLVEALSSCAFISTEGIKDATPFEFMMDLSMLGVGLGFDVLGADSRIIQEPLSDNYGIYFIPDSREGWVDSTMMLLNGYLIGDSLPMFDYSKIRERGAPIKTFGGVCPGPEPLIELHLSLHNMLSENVGRLLSGRMIVDIFTLIGKAVVSGNVRRTALLALLPEDLADLKDYEKYPERMSHGWLANHSLYGEDVEDFESLAENIMLNGEPALVWIKRGQEYGRFIDGKSKKPDKANGVNACAEMNLESFEHCLLSAIVLGRVDSLKEFINLIKLSYLYSKAITMFLVDSRWEQSSEVIKRNRRLGISLDGVAQFLGKHDMSDLISWSDLGYRYLKILDKQVSALIGVPESIKLTTIKPSGTISLLAGASSGAHLVPAPFMIKRVRIPSVRKVLTKNLQDSGVPNEVAVVEKHTNVFEFPYNFNGGTLSYANTEYPLQKQVQIAEVLQNWWADNAISLTAIIPEGTDKQDVIQIMKKSKLKTISFLPENTDFYEQLPLEVVNKKLEPISISLDYGSVDNSEALGESFCSTDICEISFELDLVKGGENDKSFVEGVTS